MFSSEIIQKFNNAFFLLSYRFSNIIIFFIGLVFFNTHKSFNNFFFIDFQFIKMLFH